MDNYKFKTYRKPQNKNIIEVIGFTWSPDEQLITDLQAYMLIDNICRDASFYSYYKEYRNIEAKTGLHYHGFLYIFDKCKWHHRSVPIWDNIGKVHPHWEFPSDLIKKDWVSYIKKQKNTHYTNHPDYA